MTATRAATASPVVGGLVIGILMLWALAVSLLATRGAFAGLAGAEIAALVAAGIVGPTIAYFVVSPLRGFVRSIGLFPLTALHVWRVPAALLFFWYGAAGLLPPAFWIPAGVGDLLVGVYAAVLIGRGADLRAYWRFHVVGFADFVIAVGSGLMHTLWLDPRMAPIAVLPLALIPLFGVGVSGASHLMAFDLLKREGRD